MTNTTDVGTTDPGTTPAPTPTVTPAITPATELGDMVEQFKREVALPGGFSTAYPTVSDDDLQDALADAFSEAQLDGWFGTYRLDLSTAEVTPVLSNAARALIVIYAGMRWIRTELRNLAPNKRYKAGPVEYETSQAASLLTQLLKDLAARRTALIATAKAGTGATYVLDAVWGREVHQLIGVFAPLELPSHRALL